MGFGRDWLLCRSKRGLGTLRNLAAIVAGEATRLEWRLERLGEAVKRRLGGQAAFVEGFVLASLVACVGPLAVLGAFADGLYGPQPPSRSLLPSAGMGGGHMPMSSSKGRLCRR